MKVLVAGATGALGKELLPRLVARGHEVVATRLAIDQLRSARARRERYVELLQVGHRADVATLVRIDDRPHRAE